MSTLKVSAINNPAASVGGLAISAGGNVTGGGLDLIVAQSFTTASSVALNDCFTSTYENYRILISLSAASVGQQIRMRLRASGSSNTTSNYFRQFLYAEQTTVASARTTSADTWNEVGYFYSGEICFIAIDMNSPQLAQITSANSIAQIGTTNSTIYQNSLSFNASTQFDGFEIYPNTGTSTGKVRVYGYRNS